jgi:hypothetical protein
MKRLLLALFLATSAHAATKPYHLELEANAAAPFPFLSKFGTITLHVYPGGVRADTLWLNGFSRTGAPAVTVENPFARMYTDVPVAQISTTIQKMSSGLGLASVGAPSQGPQLVGTVRGIAARRYRLMYGPQAWIDIWTTDAIPPNAQFHALVEQFVAGVSPAAAPVFRTIPGMPIYVELNFRRYQKLPLLRLENLAWDNAGEEDALKTGMLYFKAPLLDAIWK